MYIYLLTSHSSTSLPPAPAPPLRAQRQDRGPHQRFAHARGDPLHGLCQTQRLCALSGLPEDYGDVQASGIFKDI